MTKLVMERIEELRIKLDEAPPQYGVDVLAWKMASMELISQVDQIERDQYAIAEKMRETGRTPVPDEWLDLSEYTGNTLTFLVVWANTIAAPEGD